MSNEVEDDGARMLDRRYGKDADEARPRKPNDRYQDLSISELDRTGLSKHYITCRRVTYLVKKYIDTEHSERCRSK